MEGIELEKLEELLKNIKIDDYYIEATLQFQLLIELIETKLFTREQIQPERNIEKYIDKEDKEKYSKKEIDIVLENKDGKAVSAIELKMPMNGHFPVSMYDFIVDIHFLEELKKSNVFNQCYFIAVTNNHGFWNGPTPRQEIDIYKYFGPKISLENIRYKKPKGNKSKECEIELEKSYSAQWKNISEKSKFKYFIIVI
jgi:hypothetical protein